jgi:pimeloyl-ACP methyl ester carboxylesterase
MAPLRFLADTNTLVAIDRPGYGLSDSAPVSDARPDRQADWIAAVLEATVSGPAVVVAHSLAAAPALWLAHRRPDFVAGLVLVAPFCRPTMPAPMPILRAATTPLVGWPVRTLLLPTLAEWIASAMLDTAFEPNDVPRHMRSLPFGRMAQPSAITAMAAELRSFNRGMIPLALRLRRLRVRTMLIGGAEDRVAPFARHAAWAAKRIPDSSAVCLRGVGHMLHHVSPAIVAASVESVRGERRV